MAIAHNKKEISIGAEVETHTISVSKLHIGRHFMLPRKSVIESGESFHRDRSIGIEYASRPFETIRESLFGIKSGLRKSTTKYKFEKGRKKRKYTLFFAGTWRDRFAATHFHVGLGEHGIEYEDAVKLSRHIHGHIPFLIALMANSPVYKTRITNQDSNRFIYADDLFFQPLEFGVLDEEYREEMTFNKSRKKRIPTLEIRPCDANLPEYMVAGLVVVKAVTMGWLARKPVQNRSSHERYLKARLNAAKHGPGAKLYWNNRPLRADQYLDRFFREYQTHINRMDVPQEIFDVFRLFKSGWNGAGIIRRACQRHERRHPRTWHRYFAEDYINAIEPHLKGETLSSFLRRLGLRPPSLKQVSLGGKKW